MYHMHEEDMEIEARNEHAEIETIEGKIENQNAVN